MGVWSFVLRVLSTPFFGFLIIPFRIKITVLVKFERSDAN